MLKKLLIAAAGLMIAAPALADGGHRHSRHYAKQHHHKPRVVHYRPAPVVYYRPAPVVYYAPPRRVYHYAPPAPVFYAPGGISIRLNFPL